MNKYYEKISILFGIVTIIFFGVLILFFLKTGCLRTGPNVDVEYIESTMLSEGKSYYYKNMPSKLKTDFCALYRSIQNFETECVLPFPVSEDEFEILHYALMYDCPELLQYDKDRNVILIREKYGSRYNNVKLEYLLNENEYKIRLKKCNEVVSEFVRSVENLDIYSKEKAAYDFITGSTRYCLSGESYIGNASGVFLEGKAKCDGISLAMKWLCDEMNIPSYIIAGYNERYDIGHVWNVVYVDGHYLDVDITADVDVIEKKENSYAAFNVNDSWVRNQYKVREILCAYYSMPGSDSMKNSYYYKSGAYLKWDTNNEEIFCKNLEKTLGNKKNSFKLQVANKAVYESFMKEKDGYLKNWNEQNGKNYYQVISLNDKYNVINIRIT